MLLAVGQAAEEKGRGVSFLFDEVQFIPAREFGPFVVGLHRLNHKSLPVTRCAPSRPGRSAASSPRAAHAPPAAQTCWGHHAQALDRRRDRPDRVAARQHAHARRLDQALLERWLTNGRAGRRTVRPFIAWLQRTTTVSGSLHVPAAPAGTANLALADRERLTALRRLLADDTIDAQRRVAGCLVALYAQPVARIVRLTAADVQLTDHSAQIRLGGEPVPLPVALRTAAATLFQDALSRPRAPWLFPGQKAGQPTNPTHLARRLRELGVPRRLDPPQRAGRAGSPHPRARARRPARPQRPHGAVGQTLPATMGS